MGHDHGRDWDGLGWVENGWGRGVNEREWQKEGRKEGCWLFFIFLFLFLGCIVWQGLHLILLISVSVFVFVLDVRYARL